MYDKLITIYNREESTNDYGEKALPFKHFAMLLASVNYKGGREGFYARQVVATGDVVFKIRWYPGITESMFIEYNNRMYDIRHIAETGRNEELEITATGIDNMKTPSES